MEINRSNKIHLFFIILIVCPFVLISPFLTFVFTIIFCFLKNSYNYNLLCVFTLILFLGYINLGKQVESDLLVYREQFFFAGDVSLFTYIETFNKDFIFYFFNYLLFYVSFKSWNIYLLVITAIPYLTLLFFLNKIFFKLVKNNRHLLLSLILIAFFYPLFNYSTHLVRNFISASLVFSFVAIFSFFLKKKYIFFLLALFTHSSSILFSFIFLLKVKIKFTKVIGLMLLVPIVFFLSNLLSSSYLFIKIIDVITINDDSSSNFNLLIFLLIFSFLVIFFEYKRIKKIGLRREISYFSIIYFILIFFSIYMDRVFFLISERYLLYIYFLFTPYLVLILTGNKLINFFARIFITMTFLISFVYNLNFGTFNYATITEIITGSIIKYFI